jgi:hypothetical protein
MEILFNQYKSIFGTVPCGSGSVAEVHPQLIFLGDFLHAPFHLVGNDGFVSAMTVSCFLPTIVCKGVLAIFP